MNAEAKEDTIYFRAYPGKKQVLQNLAEFLGGNLSSLMNRLSDAALEIDPGIRTFLLDRSRIMNIPEYQVIELLSADQMAREKAQLEVWGCVLPGTEMGFPANSGAMVRGSALLKVLTEKHTAREIESRLDHLRGKFKRLSPWIGDLSTDEQKAAYEVLVSEDDREFLEEHGGAAKVLAGQ